MAEADDGRRPTIRVVLPTYKMKPSEECRFMPSEVRAIAQEVLEETLKGQSYDEENCRELTLEISESIKSRVKALNIPRYKVVVQAVIGEMKHQGVRVSSRCLWDPDTDNYTSVSYKNRSLWAVALVFGCYTE